MPKQSYKTVIKIDGKRYELRGAYSTKKEAQDIVEKVRKKGNLARVHRMSTPIGYYYAVAIHF